MGWGAIAAIIGAIAAIVGAGVGAWSAMSAGQAAEDSAEYNAQVLEAEAKAAQAKAAADEAQQREEAEALKSRQKALFLNSGVDIQSGTALAVLGAQAGDMELDALTIRAGGNAAAIKAKNQAAFYRMGGAQSKNGSYWNAGSSLLSGAGKAASIAGSYKG
jgi:protein-disulfide isomerase-like protein with CxxC motif